MRSIFIEESVKDGQLVLTGQLLVDGNLVGEKAVIGVQPPLHFTVDEYGRQTSGDMRIRVACEAIARKLLEQGL